ncbi:SDR family oxidoreductase [Pseudopelagicola sp. nBUS_20]|uniref:SDR family oxidoreductase n=1 Tax=Pseudopelagicola sp. nBUS_20 TaxID=3395317 RepID=UPI003EB98DE8
MTQTYQNHMVVLTGAGSGLGRALAINLCRNGVRVAGFGRRKSALLETANEAGKLFIPIATDVSDPAQVASAFQQVRAISPVTHLINNAAVYPHRDIFAETAFTFMETINTNLGGMVACTREALTDMGSVGRGSIVNVSSFADVLPAQCGAAYSVSKGACTIFSRALVADLSDRLPGIIVTTWMPGILATDMGIPEGMDPKIAARWGAALALWNDRTLNGAVFEMDREILAPQGLKRRLKNLILAKSQKPRRISLTTSD